MAIRKSRDEEFEINGDKSETFNRCLVALRSAGFSTIVENRAISQIQADYHKLTAWGKIEITLRAASNEMTKIHLHTTANMDNIGALISSPIDKIANAFKHSL